MNIFRLSSAWAPYFVINKVGSPCVLYVYHETRNHTSVAFDIFSENLMPISPESATLADFPSTWISITKQTDTIPDRRKLQAFPFDNSQLHACCDKFGESNKG